MKYGRSGSFNHFKVSPENKRKVIEMASSISIQNGHRVRDSFEKLKLDEPLTHRDFERIKRQLRRGNTEANK